jgi:hypothetical protein
MHAGRFGTIENLHNNETYVGALCERREIIIKPGSTACHAFMAIPAKPGRRLFADEAGGEQ